MDPRTNYKFGLSLLILLTLPATAAMALIPEPGNLVYGTVSLDGKPLTAADTQVSIVLSDGSKEIASYTMGDDPAAQDRYVLEVPMDSVLARSQDAVRPGDTLAVRYKVGTSSLAVANLVVEERGATIVLNLVVQSKDVPVGPDPSLVDSDGDGIPDVVEVASGLNPLDPSDAGLDSDGDGISNLQEYQNGTNIAVDDNPPHLIPPPDKEVSATGLFTQVDLGEATAFDAKDGILTATPDGDGYYTPGSHTVTWSVADAQGNTVTATQKIDVAPLVNFYPDQVAAEGATVAVAVELNGQAVAYPVTIPFTVSGTASGGVDYTLADGEITIDSGLVGSIEFPVLKDAVDGEGTETVVVTMGTPVNAALGSHSVFVAQIAEENIPPTVSLSASQGGGPVSLIVSDSGPVTVTAVVNDPNPGDTQSYDWSASDNALAEMDGDVTNRTFVFDPLGLTEGTYLVAATVTDAAAASGTADLFLRLVNVAPALAAVDTDGDGINDDVEGAGDSDGDGIPDYLDAVDQRNAIQAKSSVSDQYLLETEPGLIMSLGYVALGTGDGDVMVTADDVTAAYDGSMADDYTDAGGLFDFRISGTSGGGESVNVVIPLSSAIPEQADYRRFIPASGWGSFVVDTKNSVSSAPGAPGYCPPAGDAAYTPGLAAGRWCVQLLIEDGGPNDGDGLVNQAVSNLGAIATEAGAGRSSGGGGGGGSADPISLLLALFSIAYARRRRLL